MPDCLDLPDFDDVFRAVAPVPVKRVDHGCKILVRDVVDDTVRAAGDPAAARLQDFHVRRHVPIHIRRSAPDEWPRNVDVAVQGQPVPVTFLVIAVVDA
jgi:hypothetical protein